jgi:hypothetical protein
MGICEVAKVATQPAALLPPMCRMGLDSSTSLSPLLDHIKMRMLKVMVCRPLTADLLKPVDCIPSFGGRYALAKHAAHLTPVLAIVLS